MKSFREWVGESLVPSWGALRSVIRGSGSFYPERPFYDKTILNYEQLRQLYRNDGDLTNLGAGFCKPIIDRAVEYIALPNVASQDDTTDNFINECIHDYWAAQLQEMFRSAMRDSKVIVRVNQPRIDNPLSVSADRDHLKLKIYNPESVTILRDPTNDDWVEKVIIKHFIDFDDNDDPFVPFEEGAGKLPNIIEKEIWEIITPANYTYWDNTDKKWLTSWGTSNTYKFVPVVEVWNEYDASLSGGQSDLESCYPFIQAFHEVMLQSLKAHKYHSTPKIQFQVKNVLQFLKNNWPDVVGTDGNVITGSTIPWQGTEIIFTDVEEKMGFIEAKSVLGDSKTLLDFLIDCIAVASQTPEWAFMRVDGMSSSGASTSQTAPFEKRIQRKRKMFSEHIQLLAKMALVMSGKTAQTLSIVWPMISTQELVDKGQAMQQIVMGLDVASAHQWISDATTMKILASIYPEMKSPDEERALAATNVVPEVPAPAPASNTQGNQGNGSS